MPVPAPSGEDLAGVMKIVADSREMLVGIAGLELGTSGEAMLVRPDGSIVFSRRAYDPKTRFFAAELLRQRLEERVDLGGAECEGGLLEREHVALQPPAR